MSLTSLTVVGDKLGTWQRNLLIRRAPRDNHRLYYSSKVVSMASRPR